MKKLVLPAFLLCGFSSLVSAHPGHGAVGLFAGLAHPITGMDHLLAMLAVGIWATRAGGRALWMLPLAFVTSLMLGLTIGLSGASIPATELGIQVSVITLGILLAFRVRLMLITSITLVSCFALFHGYAHGSESLAHPNRGGFIIGMLLSTIFLHMLGITLGLFSRSRRVEGYVKLCGTLMTGYGLMLMSGAI